MSVDRQTHLGPWSLGFLWLAAMLTTARADVAPPAAHKLRPPALADVRAQALAWVDGHTMSDAARARAQSQWPATAGTTPLTAAETLDRLAATLAIVDPRAAQLVEMCAAPRSARPLPDTTWLLSSDTAPLVANNLRLFYGRWLAQERLYDELLEQLRGLRPADVVDPAALLFYQSVAYHRLLNRDEGLKTIDRLLADVADPPRRYAQLATLMRLDLQGLEEETLDHIARRMDDIRRHLDLGRAGQKVVKIENGVIASLDKLIEELEKQQQQQQSSSGAARPSRPMQDSRPADLKAPGRVDHKNIGNTAGWGDMPPKEREAALQQMSKDFPAHYREVIEQYFRELAASKE